MVGNAGMMEEHVPTIRALNETEALVMYQLLDRTRRHTRHSLKHETTKRAIEIRMELNRVTKARLAAANCPQAHA